MPSAIEAGISPTYFWEMTFGEICAAIKGYRQRVQWQAMLTYTAGTLHCAALHSAFDNKPFPVIQDVFPSLFNDIPCAEQKQPWQIMQERVLAHSEDYIRNRGDTH